MINPASLCRQQLQDWLDEDMEWEEYQSLLELVEIPGPQPIIPRTRIDRGRAEGHIRLWNDYFALPSKFNDSQFARQFRMSRTMVMMLCDKLQSHNPFWVQKPVSLWWFCLSQDTYFDWLFEGCMWCSWTIYTTEGDSVPSAVGNGVCSRLCG